MEAAAGEEDEEGYEEDEDEDQGLDEGDEDEDDDEFEGEEDELPLESKGWQALDRWGGLCPYCGCTCALESIHNCSNR